MRIDQIEPHYDGSGTLEIPNSKTDQDGRGAYAWLSPHSMLRLNRWSNASDIGEGIAFRRIAAAHRRAKDNDALSSAERVYTIGPNSLTRQGVNAIYRRVAESAFEQGLVDVSAAMLDKVVKAISTHSLRVGLTQDLFAAGEDGTSIAHALRWASTVTALRYGRELSVRSNAAAKLLRRVRA